MSENSNKLNIVQVCNYLGVGPVTLNRWYNIQKKIKESGECPDMPDLPPFHRVNDTPRGAKYWYIEDLDKFSAFLEWRQKGRAGKFGKYNAKYWGETGVKALLKKGEIDEIRKNPDNNEPGKLGPISEIFEQDLEGVEKLLKVAADSSSVDANVIANALKAVQSIEVMN